MERGWPYQEYMEMMTSGTAVDTKRFHKVLGLLLRAPKTYADEIEFMRGLLHMPVVGAIEWQEYALELMRQGRISTVDESEVVQAYKSEEGYQPWEVLAERVIQQRREDVAAEVAEATS
ncbi:MAG: hypothetical protein US89_C0015G0029 [Candidatus Peregrinibacteria bacterium GW2011_GWF2_38_29]|nr:MAG: hypothetical protein US89_C0015G0029 [Candidatus Peregrinibacteria bacterium GW2011_GWF2_38_29]HBB02711.1 hypothetical protein [Candidatus Peregrinibacteria bacterium]